MRPADHLFHVLEAEDLREHAGEARARVQAQMELHDDAEEAGT